MLSTFAAALVDALLNKRTRRPTPIGVFAVAALVLAAGWLGAQELTRAKTRFEKIEAHVQAAEKPGGSLAELHEVQAEVKRTREATAALEGRVEKRLDRVEQKVDLLLIDRGIKPTEAK